ncbi:uncharacterized protein LOC118513106 [Anopheles stephensi]|uniref:uncharacterized protein LOC118513106 n=1 Tax=Anopheles stephensi TaxID=30069 RepID=UPI001658BEE4|nr:uncharacterized protein LOC118513106 [Anopheles stephensi]
MSIMSSVSSTRVSTVRTGRKCFLCQNTRYRSKHCRLFRFPVRGTAMWNRWLTAMNLTEATIRTNERPRLCQRHFDPKDFLTRQLSGMAVPVRHLNRSKPAKRALVEEEQAFPSIQILEAEGEQASDASGSECSELLDEIISECEEAADELPVLSTNAPVGEQSNEANATALMSATECRCSVPQHHTLEELLLRERSRVEKLLKVNSQQKHIIEEQRNLLWELGVECVTQQTDQPSNDSD